MNEIQILEGFGIGLAQDVTSTLNDLVAQARATINDAALAFEFVRGRVPQSQLTQFTVRFSRLNIATAALVSRAQAPDLTEPDRERLVGLLRSAVVEARTLRDDMVRAGQGGAGRAVTVALVVVSAAAIGVVLLSAFAGDG